MKTFIIAVTIFTFFESYPQSYVHHVSVFPQGFGIEQLNSKGTSGLINNVSNISAMNPASIQQLEHLSFGFSYQFQTNIPDAWRYEIGTKRVYNYLPQSLGGVYHYNDFIFGIGVGQKYNGSIDLGSIIVTTTQDPDGTGEIYTPEFENMLQYYSVVAAYNFRDILIDDSELNFGIKYNLNRFYVYERIDAFSFEENLWGSNVEIGTQYTFEYDQETKIRLGLSFKTLTSLENEADHELTTRTGIPGSREEIYTVTVPQKTILDLPSEATFEFVLEPSLDYTITGSIKEIFLNSAFANMENQPEFSSTFIYNFEKSVSASLGIYYSDWRFKEDFLDMNGALTAFFITTGASFNINFLNINIALADSHLFSGEYRKQTIGKIAVGIQL
jgi:hypothetical protein